MILDCERFLLIDPVPLHEPVVPNRESKERFYGGHDCFTKKLSLNQIHWEV